MESADKAHRSGLTDLEFDPVFGIQLLQKPLWLPRGTQDLRPAHWLELDIESDPATFNATKGPQLG